MEPEELPSKARCVSHPVGFTFSQADGTRVQVYILHWLSGRDFLLDTCPGFQTIRVGRGVGDHLVQGTLQMGTSKAGREERAQDLQLLNRGP